MDTDGNRTPLSFGRLGSIAGIAWTEVQYWMVGLTPETYHWAQGSAWEGLGNYTRAARHLRRYLESNENAHVRALLAYCLAQTGSWKEAASEYAAVSEAWPHPIFALGLAEAEFRMGNADRAAQLIATVESSHPQLEATVQEALTTLKSQMQSTQ